MSRGRRSAVYGVAALLCSVGLVTAFLAFQGTGRRRAANLVCGPPNEAVRYGDMRDRYCASALTAQRRQLAGRNRESVRARVSVSHSVPLLEALGATTSVSVSEVGGSSQGRSWFVAAGGDGSSWVGSFPARSLVANFPGNDTYDRRLPIGVLVLPPRRAALFNEGQLGTRRSAAAGGRPHMRVDLIPYGHRRKHEMALYSRRHYGITQWRLRHPKVIVLHFTGGSSYSSAWNTFASNAPNHGELPGVCAHFIVGRGGRIYKVVRVKIRCRHTIGLNYTSIGIEMVQPTGAGAHWADQQILHRHRQIHAALRLVKWLKIRFDIRRHRIIGHAMANASPLFKDHEGWRNTHTDWLREDVRVFRRRLAHMS